MRIALNGASTMPADLETDIRIASQAGYDLIEIWGAKLDVYLKTHTTRELAGLLARAGVKPHAINSIEHINLRLDDDYKRIKDSCHHLSLIARDIDCPNIVVVPSPKPPDVTPVEVQENTVGVLRELSGIAAEFEIQLAFEMLGQPQCSVRTLADAWDIVKWVNRRNVGLVLDTFHFYTGGSRLSSIVDLDPHKLFIFHINDAEKGDPSGLTDAQRLLPGDGVIPLPDICRGLRNAGYKDMVSIELFRPEYWTWDPLKLAQTAKDKTERIIRSVWS
jgi:2-keto-myo-inositol isomerase